MTEQITLARLREQLSYDPVSGDFHWVCADMRGKNSREVPAGGKSSKGYWRIKVGPRYYYAHRLAWLFVNGSWPLGLIDHLNGNKLDNRIDNLRDVRPGVNVQNQRKPSRNNKTGFLGICAEGVIFKACIKVDGRTLHLGRFETPEEAHAAYVTAKRTHHEGCTL